MLTVPQLKNTMMILTRRASLWIMQLMRNGAKVGQEEVLPENFSICFVKGAYTENIFSQL